MSQSIEPHESGGEAGFTLIETLIALAIIAISLPAIGSVMAANIRGTEVVGTRLALLQTARALLAALPNSNQLKPGESRGEMAHEHWRIDVLPFAADFVDSSKPTPWVPQTVILRVESPNGEILRIDTVRLRRNQGSEQ